MLVIVSDLHFRDGTAGEHNVSTRAFEWFLEALAALSRSSGASEVKILFPGDIFDLLRTEMWFAVPADERPWGLSGAAPEALERHAGYILDAILEHPVNRETFALLSGSLKERFPQFPAEPERIYVPGNHDRLCAQFPSLLRKVQQALGAAPAPVLHVYRDPRYGVLARHGHEHDVFNYEGGSTFSDEDYAQVPIGDVITTELVARLPYTIMAHPKVRALPAATQKALRRNLQQIENVRPLHATLHWLFYQVQQHEWLRGVVEDAIDEVVAHFNNLPFVRDWYRRHDRWPNPLDEADQIQTVLFLLDKFRVTRMGGLLALAEALKGIRPRPAEEAARRELAEADPDVYYLVYGHTHQPVQIPIGIGETADGKPMERVYLNTGCWGTRHVEAADGGFVSWKQMAYAVFHAEDEDLPPEQERRGFPSFETWSATLKESLTWPPLGH
ncbi:MAG: metallophosphoesterase [Anaerolineae bacterium]|nr:metallophosphoesterase [Anaerolineae bacterium]